MPTTAGAYGTIDPEIKALSSQSLDFAPYLIFLFINRLSDLSLSIFGLSAIRLLIFFSVYNHETECLDGLYQTHPVLEQYHYHLTPNTGYGYWRLHWHSGSLHSFRDPHGLRSGSMLLKASSGRCCQELITSDTSAAMQTTPLYAQNIQTATLSHWMNEKSMQ